MFRKTIKARKIIEKYSIGTLVISDTIIKYAPSPTKANELFSNNDIHNPNPEIVPNNGPKARSIKTYAPPDFGIAVASSDFESAAGTINSAAIKYASQIEDPVFAAAIPGNTKIPLPSIPPILIAMIAGRVSVLLSFFILCKYSF